jgi:hypothetical protein
MTVKLEVWGAGPGHEDWFPAEWREVPETEPLPAKIRTFVDAMDILALIQGVAEGSLLVFWWDDGEVSARSWASPSALLYRLTCTSTPLSGKVEP